jgi:hypothetical protein
MHAGTSYTLKMNCMCACAIFVCAGCWGCRTRITVVTTCRFLPSSLVSLPPSSGSLPRSLSLSLGHHTCLSSRHRPAHISLFACGVMSLGTCAVLAGLFCCVSRPLLLSAGLFCCVSRPLLLSAGLFCCVSRPLLLSAGLFCCVSRPLLLSAGLFCSR